MIFRLPRGESYRVLPWFGPDNSVIQKSLSSEWMGVKRHSLQLWGSAKKKKCIVFFNLKQITIPRVFLKNYFLHDPLYSVHCLWSMQRPDSQAKLLKMASLLHIHPALMYWILGKKIKYPRHHFQTEPRCASVSVLGDSLNPLFLVYSEVTRGKQKNIDNCPDHWALMIKYIVNLKNRISRYLHYLWILIFEYFIEDPRHTIYYSVRLYFASPEVKHKTCQSRRSMNQIAVILLESHWAFNTIISTTIRPKFRRNLPAVKKILSNHLLN